MFPQEGETTPRVRFKGFEGEWEKVRASDIFKTYNEKNRPDLPVLSATQDKGMVTREALGYNIFHDKSNEATYKHILPGQFVIHLRSFQGGFAHSAIEGIASPAYTIMDFKDKSRHYDLFWKYIFMSKEFIKRLELITYGIRDGRSISFDEFSEMYFTVPSFNEQKAIASYFTSLDTQITLQSQRLEKLKQIKSACLDNMFV
jgi:type I restriction enzyme S subunit